MCIRDSESYTVGLTVRMMNLAVDDSLPCQIMHVATTLMLETTPNRLYQQRTVQETLGRAVRHAQWAHARAVARPLHLRHHTRVHDPVMAWIYLVAFSYQWPSGCMPCTRCYSPTRSSCRSCTEEYHMVCLDCQHIGYDCFQCSSK